MKRKSITQVAWALPLVALIAILLPLEAESDTTGGAICQYKTKQTAALYADDLHFQVEVTKDTEIRMITVGTAPPYVDKQIDVDPDGKGATVYLEWANNSISYGESVFIQIGLILRGIEGLETCNNTQKISDAYWTNDGDYVGKAHILDHEWSVYPRETNGGTDTHPFELVNFDGGSFHVRSLEFHYGPDGIVGDDLFDFTGWMSGLYTGGDFTLLPGNTMTHDIVIPAQGEDLIHIHGHYELWSGSLPGDSLLVECWFHHYDFEALAVRMGKIQAGPDGNGSIEVSWSTQSETDNAGFEVYRSLSADGTKTKISRQLISSTGCGLGGAAYVYTDTEVSPGLTYYYWVKDVDLYGQGRLHGPVSASVSGKAARPLKLSLAQNSPNPFRAMTEIEYGLPSACEVSVRIYSTEGREVKTLTAGPMPAGYHVAVWDGTNTSGAEVSGGVYYYRLEAGPYVKMKKMVYMK